MMRGPPPGYNVPRGFVPRGGYEPRDPRDPRDLREYENRRHHGPSPWIPATILGVIFFITGMPWMRSTTIYPDPVVAYQAAAAAAAVRPSYSFPLPLLWIPVLAVIGIQFFGGNWYGDGYGPFAFRGGRGGAMYGGRGGYRADPYAPGAYRNRGLAPDRVGAEYNRGWGGWWPWSTPSWNENNRYNNYQQRGLMSVFMDYGGHWFLILLGIAVFSLVSSSSLPSPPAVLPLPPLAPQTLGFPWSLFF